MPVACIRSTPPRARRSCCTASPAPFGGQEDGSAPVGELVAVDGVLYGATSFGGQFNGGTIFSFDPATGAETVVYSFGSGHRRPDARPPGSWRWARPSTARPRRAARPAWARRSPFEPRDDEGDAAARVRGRRRWLGALRAARRGARPAVRHDLLRRRRRRRHRLPARSGDPGPRSSCTRSRERRSPAIPLQASCSMTASCTERPREADGRIAAAVAAARCSRWTRARARRRTSTASARAPTASIRRGRLVLDHAAPCTARP